MAAVALLATAPAQAQSGVLPPPPSPLVRADVYGTLGWFNAEADLRHSDWYNRILHGGAGFGWYWSDHVRTELEVGATTDADVYSSEPVTIAGQTTYVGFRQSFSARKVGVGQYYQFYRNVWFHPQVGAGVDLTWARTERVDEPAFVFDPGTRQGRIGRERQQRPPTTSLEVRPFVAAGFKTYMTQRAFFRSDVRVGVRHGVEEVLVRAGFGVDF